MDLPFGVGILWATDPPLRTDEFDFDGWVKTTINLVLLATVVYTLFARAATRKLLQRLNKGYKTVLGVGVSVVGAMYPVLSFQAKSGDPMAILNVIRPIITAEPTKPGVGFAFYASMLGVSLIVLGVLCRVKFPYDPAAFAPKEKDRTPAGLVALAGKAIQYYTAQKGGLEYAALLILPRDRPLPTAEELYATRDPKADPRPYRVIDFLSKWELTADGRNAALKAEDAQAEVRRHWLALARRVYVQSLQHLEQAHGCKLGHILQVQTGMESGGVLFEYLHDPSGVDPDYILFGLTLSPTEVDNRRFGDHFAMLKEALRVIVPSKRSLGPLLAPPVQAVPPSLREEALPADEARTAGS